MQAEVPGEIVSRVEADAVVGNVERYLFTIAFHSYLYAIRTGVFDYVVEGFLGDAMYGLLSLQRSLRFIADAGLHVDLVPGPERGRLFFERHCEPLRLQRLRA